MKRSLLLLTGAAAVWCMAACQPMMSVAPSLKYCREVQYVRSGNEIDLRAKCSLPVADSVVPGL